MNYLIGKKINRLLVLSEEPKRGYIRFFKCKCDCGNIKITRGSSIKNGSCKSCGCLQKEQIKRLGLSKATHGYSGTRFYKIWKDMFTRCYNKNCEEYKNYGGRGIEVCEEWNDFENFKNDMLPIYKDNLSIDRIDNDGNYELNNCRWATIQEQNNNRRMFKLTKDKIKNIRDKYKKGKYGIGRILANEYNVSSAVISEIVNYKRNYRLYR